MKFQILELNLSNFIPPISKFVSNFQNHPIVHIGTNTTEPRSGNSNPIPATLAPLAPAVLQAPEAPIVAELFSFGQLTAYFGEAGGGLLGGSGGSRAPSGIKLGDVLCRDSDIPRQHHRNNLIFENIT